MAKRSLEQRIKELTAKQAKQKQLEDAKKNLELARKALQKARGK